MERHNLRTVINYDVIIVGGGPSGLSTAIRLKQNSIKKNIKISICVLEKGSKIGSHILSGAIIEPFVIYELFPNLNNINLPLDLQVKEERFLFLTKNKSYNIPICMLPKTLRNEKNYIISLSNFTIWLGEQAEKIGIDIFSGFSANEIIYNYDGSVKGVATNNLGITKKGKPSIKFQYGVEIHSRFTVFCEGARGYLTQKIIKKFKLSYNSDHQVYSFGIKELWEISSKMHKLGLVIHTVGWPLNNNACGGSFIYHLNNNKLAIGLILGLNYDNPYLSPFEEFQKYKTHPEIKKILVNGRRISYGARAIISGGLMSLPKFIFPGGALVGDCAGFLNTSKIKGSHTAIKSGILAADSIFNLIKKKINSNILYSYPKLFKNSWLYKELYESRNFKQWMNIGLYIGSFMISFEQKILRNFVPWTLHNNIMDNFSTKLAIKCKNISYLKPDDILTFDKLSSVFMSNTNHKEDQPKHIILKNHFIPLEINFKKYIGLENNYCPAGVYEYIKNSENKYLLIINSQNCIHCKVCDIKDPKQNIIWTLPEGGGGPNYNNM